MGLYTIQAKYLHDKLRNSFPCPPPFNKPFLSLKPQSDCFGIQTINCWNTLQYNIVNASSLPISKNKLDEHWEHLFYTHSS